MDALLGASGNPDIGTLFPNTDPTYKGADSIKLLTEVMSRIKNQGWSVVNIDCALLAEVPKISPFVAAIKGSLARALHVEDDAVGVKATTTEKLGSIGRSEGMAAFVTTLIQREK